MATRAFPRTRIAPPDLQPYTLAVDAACPDCHRRPALGITPEERDLARTQAPETVKLSYRCGREGCGAFYTITAADYGRAYARKAAA